MKYLFLILFIVGCGSNLVAFSVDDNSFNIDHRIVDWCKVVGDYSSCLKVDDEKKCEDKAAFSPVFDDIENDKNFLSRQHCIDNELDKFTGQSCQSIEDAIFGQESSSNQFEPMEIYNVLKCDKLLSLVSVKSEEYYYPNYEYKPTPALEYVDVPLPLPTEDEGNKDIDIEP